MLGIPQDYILYIHIATLSVAAAGIIAADKIGFAWFRGTRETVSPHTLHTLHTVVGLALTFMLATGLLLFWPARAFLVTEATFYIKMLFVALLVLNSFAIEYLMETATHTPFRNVSVRHKRLLFLSGAISLGSWVGAATAAFFLLP